MEACWAHNPKVIGSKPIAAMFFFDVSDLQFCATSRSTEILCLPKVTANNGGTLLRMFCDLQFCAKVRGDIYELWKKSSVVFDGLLSFYDDARAINAFRLCLYRAAQKKEEGVHPTMCSPDHVLCAMSMNGMELVNNIESFLLPSSINARRTIVYFVRTWATCATPSSA